MSFNTTMYGFRPNGDDTGQLHHPNVNLEGVNCNMQKEPPKSVYNFGKNQQERNDHPYQNVRLQTLSPPYTEKHSTKDEKELKILIEKRYDSKNNQENNELIMDTVKKVVTLLTNFKNDKVIKGIYSKDKETKRVIETVNEFSTYDNWLLPLRVIKMKKVTKVEIMLAVHTKCTAFQLYQHQSEMFTKENMKISSKRTQMKHTKRIGFLVGPYLQLASVQEYEQQIYKMTQLENELIEIKKDLIYERNVKTKALVIYAVEENAAQIEQQLNTSKMQEMKYVSFKTTTSEMRIGAMKANEWINIKSRFETLFNVNKHEIIMKNGIQETLKTCILKQEHNGIKLFLAIETGSGQSENDTHVVINPEVKF